MLPTFEPFIKIARFSREIVITEKIDGTNAQIFIGDDNSIIAGSRTRWLAPGADNFGFAAWVKANEEELLRLGPGRHFGEWWGAGIQRRYGRADKVFSLFNVSKWADDAVRPSCCRVVPELYRGLITVRTIDLVLNNLIATGSRAEPGFMNPEGIVIFHTASSTLFKKTCEKDELWKGQQVA